MAQQTAVEWLFEKLTSTWYDVKSSQDLLKQAKAMEKEQIKFAYKDGADDTIEKRYKGMEEYYNKMYNHE
jgi:hypothetical protein